MNPDRDNRIARDPETRYRIDGIPPAASVTTLVKSQSQPFDGRKALAVMRPENRNAPPYQDLTDDQILDMWQQKGRLAADLGTRVHAWLEEFVLLNIATGNTSDEPTPPPIPDDIAAECAAGRRVMDYLGELGWVPLIPEYMVFDDSVPSSTIAGTIDCIFVMKSDPTKFLLIDWKRCSKFSVSSGFYDFPADNKICDCTYHRYSLQLSIYREILERHYLGSDSKICDCFIVLLYPGGTAIPKPWRKKAAPKPYWSAKNSMIFKAADLRSVARKLLAPSVLEALLLCDAASDDAPN